MASTAYPARLLLRIARTRWTNSCHGRAAQEPVLLRPSLSQSAGLFKPKELGGARAVAAVIPAPCPWFFFLASLLRCQDRGLNPWFISLPVMSWVLCGPLASRTSPQPKPPPFSMTQGDHDRDSSGMELVSGERWKVRYTQPMSSLCLVIPVELCGVRRRCCVAQGQSSLVLPRRLQVSA